MRADVLNNLFGARGRLTTDSRDVIAAAQPSRIGRASRSDIGNHYQHVAIIRYEFQVTRRLAVDRQRLWLNRQIYLLTISIYNHRQRFVRRKQSVATDSVPIRIWVSIKRDNSIARPQAGDFCSASRRDGTDDRSWRRWNPVKEPGRQWNCQRRQDIHNRPGQCHRDALPTRTQVKAFLRRNVGRAFALNRSVRFISAKLDVTA